MSQTEPAIRLVRPLQNEYLTMAKLFTELGNNGIYSMTQTEFIKYFMEKSGGSSSPTRVKELYKALIQEAGIAPKFKCPISYEGCTEYCGSYGCGG